MKLKKPTFIRKSELSGVVVCWNCQQSSRQLMRVINKKGKKTKDYVCLVCKKLGFDMPPVEDVSIAKISP